MPRVGEAPSFLLRSRADIEHIKRVGRRVQTPLFNLVFCDSRSLSPRVGIVVGKRLGGAVQRNRAKRIFRELARWVRASFRPDRELLVFPRRESIQVHPATLRQAWLIALVQEDLLVNRPNSECEPSSSR